MSDHTKGHYSLVSCLTFPESWSRTDASQFYFGNVSDHSCSGLPLVGFWPDSLQHFFSHCFFHRFDLYKPPARAICTSRLNSVTLIFILKYVDSMAVLRSSAIYKRKTTPAVYNSLKKSLNCTATCLNISACQRSLSCLSYP